MYLPCRDLALEMVCMHLAAVAAAVAGGACGCRRDQCCTRSSQLVDLRKAYDIIVQ